MHPKSLPFFSSAVLASLKSVHETLSQERQKLQEVLETNNIHQSNTLAEVGFILRLSSGSSGAFLPLWFLMAVSASSSLAGSSEELIPRPPFGHRFGCGVLRRQR